MYHTTTADRPELNLPVSSEDGRQGVIRITKHGLLAFLTLFMKGIKYEVVWL